MKVVSERMDFSYALKYAKEGLRISREGWNGRGQYVCYQEACAITRRFKPNVNPTSTIGRSDESGSRCLLPFLLIRTVDGSFVPWLASQTDLLAEDWVIVE